MCRIDSANKFAALHAACWSGGTLLYVPKGVVIDEPLHTLAALAPGGVDFSHILVVLEENAEATLLTETAGGAMADESASGLHVGAIELIVGPNAKLRYVNLQNWGTGVWHFAHQKALVESRGQLQWTIGALGSRLAKVNQHVALTGEEANCQVNGVMFTGGVKTPTPVPRTFMWFFGPAAYARAADYLRAPPAEALGETFFTRRIRFLVRRMDPQLAAMLANFP